MVDTQLSHRRGLIPGLDLLRLTALGLVTLQHCFTSLGQEEWSRVGGILIGRLGVAILLAIAGLLAMSSSRSPLAWFRQRLVRLFPAYWLVLALSVVLTLWSGHKQVDFLQTAFQACGIGLFTGPQSIVNLVTWFISLILVCYLVATSIRLLPGQAFQTTALLAVTAALTVFIACGGTTEWGLRRTLAFFAAGIVALAPDRTRLLVAAGLAAVFGVCTPLWHEQFAYPAIALGALAIATQYPRSAQSMPWTHRTAEYSYEYYLVHGIALFGTIEYLTLPTAIAVPVGILLAMAMAIIVRQTVIWMQRTVTWRRRPSVSAGAVGHQWEFIAFRRGHSTPQSEVSEVSEDEVTLSTSRQSA